MSPYSIVRAAIPGADDDTCEHVIWARTPFPCGPVTPKELYQAAARMRRASEHGLQLCDWCDRIADADRWTCKACDAALHPDRAKALTEDRG